MIYVVYKKTNGMLHDLQWKEEKDMDVDDSILEGWDRVPNREELALLHDKEYTDKIKFEKENSDLLEHLKENDIKCVRAIREWIIGASTGMVSALRIYDVIAQQARDRLNEIKISKV